MDQITKALSQFQLSLVSANSKYDKVLRGEASFILPEKLGYEIFEKNVCPATRLHYLQIIVIKTQPSPETLF